MQLLAAAAALWCGTAASSAVDFDVVVYGSSPAGIAAATAAGHLGMTVGLCGTGRGAMLSICCNLPSTL